MYLNFSNLLGKKHDCYIPKLATTSSDARSHDLEANFNTSR